jgi:hypothetical protein
MNHIYVPIIYVIHVNTHGHPSSYLPKNNFAPCFDMRGLLHFSSYYHEGNFKFFSFEIAKVCRALAGVNLLSPVNLQCVMDFMITGDRERVHKKHSVTLKVAARAGIPKC